MLSYLPNPLIIPVGIIIGILIAAPVGPVNVLCVQRAIERGFWGGVAAGIGSVLGDGLIALCAGLGVGAITGAIKNNRAIIQVAGGLALAIFGVRLYFSDPNLKIASAKNGDNASLKDYIWDIPQTFFLTITNPGALLGLATVFGGVSTFVEVQSTIDVLLLVAALMSGSLLWWISLSHLISRYRHLMDAGRLQLVNRIAGTLLGGFGLLLLLEVIWKGGRF